MPLFKNQPLSLLWVSENPHRLRLATGHVGSTLRFYGLMVQGWVQSAESIGSPVPTGIEYSPIVHIQTACCGGVREILQGGMKLQRHRVLSGSRVPPPRAKLARPKFKV